MLRFPEWKIVLAHATVFNSFHVSWICYSTLFCTQCLWIWGDAPTIPLTVLHLQSSYSTYVISGFGRNTRRAVVCMCLMSRGSGVFGWFLFLLQYIKNKINQLCVYDALQRDSIRRRCREIRVQFAILQSNFISRAGALDTSFSKQKLLCQCFHYRTAPQVA